MKELHFEYHMKLSFDTPVEKHRFTLKCVPRSGERQEISDLSVDVYPKEFLSTYKDSFGNACIYGHAEGKHDHFSALVTGKAKTGLAPSETAREDYQIGLYRYQTNYTAPGPVIRAFADRIPFAPDATGFEKALQYMKELYGHFQYVQGVTDISTTAEQAMAQGAGVCQDYSHILLSLCRIQHIPARYVVGMLMGEGLSHAWVEICHNGHWIALDPTNNLIVDDQHIKISSGRDYKDCTVNQGVFVGQTRQTQEASVKVWE
ncbi:MAG: transglutaminase family protein [Lachnospiraceae bacterium]|nr:transglutaminase family protein [Lachnospiraceae bacterium]